MCVSQYLTELWIFEQNYAHWAHCAGGGTFYGIPEIPHTTIREKAISPEKKLP